MLLPVYIFQVHRVDRKSFRKLAEQHYEVIFQNEHEQSFVRVIELIETPLGPWLLVRKRMGESADAESGWAVITEKVQKLALD